MNHGAFAIMPRMINTVEGAAALSISLKARHRMRSGGACTTGRACEKASGGESKNIYVIPPSWIIGSK
jgi:esterase/lipase superfamily enzyme